MRRIVSLIFLLFFTICRYEAAVTMIVDVGQEYIKVALSKATSPMEMVLNSESNRKTLNAVAFSKDSRFIGDSAYSMFKKYPKSSFPSINMVLGKDYHSKSVEKYLETFKNIKLTEDPETKTPVFFAESFNKSFSVEALFSMLLKEARAFTDSFSVDPVTEMVLAVPAFTDVSQRLYYKKAAEIAGIKLTSIYDSNIASCIRYESTKLDQIPKEKHKMMIVDCGGFKTEATIYDCEQLPDPKKSKSTYPSCAVVGYGFTKKGGNKITKRVKKLLIKKLEKRFNTKFESKFDTPSKHHLLQEEALRVKHVLTGLTEARIYVESFHEEEDWNDSINRDEFEEAISSYASKMLTAIDHAMNSAKVHKNDLKTVVLMGGSSRIPLVQKIIKEKTGVDQLSNALNTDDDIAMGGAFLSLRHFNTFKVIKLECYPSSLLPFVISYNKTEYEDGVPTIKHVEKELFGYMKNRSVGKVLTIKNITEDFNITIKYGGAIPEHYKIDFDPKVPVSKVAISGVQEAIELYKEHYNLVAVRVSLGYDKLGIVSVTSVDAMFHKNSNLSTFERLKKTVSDIFKSNGQNHEESFDEYQSHEHVSETSKVSQNNQSSDDNFSKESSDSSENLNKTSEKNEWQSFMNSSQTDQSFKNETLNSTTTGNFTEQNFTNKSAARKNVTKEPKLVEKFKFPLKFIVEYSSKLPSYQEMNKIKDVIKVIAEEEQLRDRNAKALSDLESLIINAKEYFDEYGKYYSYVSGEEKDSIMETVNNVSIWFEENGYASNYSVNNRQKRILRRSFKFVEERFKEENTIGERISAIMNYMEVSEKLLDFEKNSSEFRKRINKTEFDDYKADIEKIKYWGTNGIKEYKSKKPWEKKPFTLADVKFLFNKIQEATSKFANIVFQIRDEQEKLKKAADKFERLRKKRANNSSTKYNESLPNNDDKDDDLFKNVTTDKKNGTNNDHENTNFNKSASASKQDDAVNSEL